MLDEVLDLLPRHDGSPHNPHKVADWLNQHCRIGELQLFVGGVEIAPAAIQNGMITVVGRISQDTGARSLEGQIRGGWNASWGKNPAFAFDRKSFMACLGGAKDPGGRPPEYSREPAPEPPPLTPTARQMLRMWPDGRPVDLTTADIMRMSNAGKDAVEDGLRILYLHYPEKWPRKRI
jgi:hypothetical protein